MFSYLYSSARKLLIVILLALLLPEASLIVQVNAQTTSGTVVGRVRQRGNRPLHRARVRIINQENGNKRTTLTDPTGHYTIPNLPPGSYRIVASKEGFIADSVNRFPVQFNQNNLVKLPEFTLRQVTVSGVVVDRDDYALLNARVTLTNSGGEVIGQTSTDNTGGYSLTDVPTGEYTITASWAGGQGESATSVPVSLEEEIVSAPPLKIVAAVSPTQQPAQQPQGQVVEGDTVASSTHPLDAARTTNISEQQVHALPLGGSTYMRTFDELALLVPGVAPPPYTPGARGPGVGFGVGTAGQFSVNGLRARSNNFTVDGSDNNDPDVGVRRQGFVALVPQSVESVREVSISTLLWSTELNRNFASQVNVVSKYGTDDFHGQAYAFFNDSRLNARNFFDYTGKKDPFTRTQAGFAIGGPIVRQKTHFFTSFERQVVNASTEQHFATPGLADRRFLGLPDFAVLKPNPFFQSTDVFTTTVGTTPLGAAVLSLYPLPNNPGGPFGDNTYTELLPADGRGIVGSMKVTHQFNDNNTLDVRYNVTDDNRLIPSVNRAIRSTIGSDTRTQNVSLILDTALTQNLFNQARFSYGRTRLDFIEQPNSPFIFQSSFVAPIEGLGNVPVSTGPIGELHVEPFSPVGVNVFSFPQNRANNTFQYADAMSWSVGAHSLKFGADIRRVQLNGRVDRNYRPQVVFGNAVARSGSITLNNNPDNPFTFTPGDDLLLPGIQLATLGLPSSIFQVITAGTPDSTVGLRSTEYNFFVNDIWRVRQNFNLDFGVRYEYNTVPQDVRRRIEDSIRLKNLPVPGASTADAPVRTAAFNAAVAAYMDVLGGKRNQIYDGDRNNVGPRFGFAWDPWSDGKTAVRGGYGIYYDVPLGAVVSQSRNVFPREVPINVEPAFLAYDIFELNNPSLLFVSDGVRGAINPIPLIKPGTINQFGGNPADFVAVIGQLFFQNADGGGLAFTLPAKNLQTPYAQHWHLTLERELPGNYTASVAYVGTKGTKLTRLTTPNNGPNSTPIIPIADRFLNFPAGASLPTALVLADCKLDGGEQCSLSPRRPEPALGSYQIFENTANSNYHALQVELHKRYSHGYQFTAAYTWSHAIDDVSDVFPIAGAPIIAQNSFDFRAERGNANFDIRHRFVTSLVWDLPFYSNAVSGAKRLLGGWQVATIFQAQTGQPFTLNVPFDSNLDGNLTDRPSTSDGLIFFSGHTRQRVALAPNKDVVDYIIPGEDGAVGRNTVRGDNFINLDFAMNKNFRVTERQRIEFRAEFFNLLNRSNFGLPIRELGAPGFGAAIETVNPARTIQFALKYAF